jgi:putative flippase GtrA
VKNLPRYFLVGGTAATVDLSFFLIFSTWLGFNYLFVGILGFVIATFVNYVLSIRWVFISGQRFTRQTEIQYVYIISLAGLGLHALILYSAVTYFGLLDIAGKIIATGLVFFWNYSARNYYVFKPTA